MTAEFSPTPTATQPRENYDRENPPPLSHSGRDHFIHRMPARNSNQLQNQLVTPQQLRDLQGQYINARGDRLTLGLQGEVQWSQIFADENGSCRETFTGKLLQF